MELKFYKCKHCGNIIAVVKASGAPISCCGEKMTEIVPGTVDASKEKHIPVISVNGNKVHVAVGSVEHPMTPEHFIDWIALQTKEGNQRKVLKSGVPSADFMLCDGDEVIAAYAYCNLHGLWKAEL